MILWPIWRTHLTQIKCLIVIVELKRLFQGSRSLEDFHTKALRLVKEADYPEGDTRNRVLRDTIISGLASDKIHAKVIKERKDLTLARVTEIVRLEVSTQWHIDRMQETMKINYVQYGKGSKKKKGRSRPSGDSGRNTTLQFKRKWKETPLPTDICWRCGKSLHQKGQPCRATEAVFRSCGTKGHYEKVCMRKSTHLAGVPSSSSDSDPDYFDEFGEPVYVQTHLVHTKEIHKKKHLIQFPISVNLEKVRKLAEGPCPTVLLKADTGVDVNLLNSTTFDRIIGDRSILQPSTYKMEAYGNSTVDVLGKFFAFLRLKGKIYRQLFFMTRANASPNLLSRDGCYTLGVLKPFYLVETLKTLKSSSTQPTTDLEQHQMHGRSFQHWSDEGTGLDKQSNSTEQSLYKDHLQGDSLKKQNILRVYSVVTTGIDKSPDDPCEFQL